MSFDPKQINHWPTIAKCFATGLLLMAAVAAACAQEPTKDSHEISIDQMLSAIAQVETACVRTGPGNIRGVWAVGTGGEVSPFQIHPSVLKDLGVAGRTRRIHADPLYAESVAILWLVHLGRILPDSRSVFAAWNGGIRGRNSRAAQDYAQRCMNLAEEYAK